MLELSKAKNKIIKFIWFFHTSFLIARFLYSYLGISILSSLVSPAPLISVVVFSIGHFILLIIDFKNLEKKKIYYQLKLESEKGKILKINNKICTDYQHKLKSYIKRIYYFLINN